MSKITPTLFIGLGGTGFYAISEIKKTIANKYFEGNPDFPLTSYLAIDTEFLSADKINKLRETGDFDEVDFVTTFDSSNIKDIERIETTVIPDNVKSILKNPGLTGLEDFVPERADEFIEVKGDGASGVGLVGKIALANNFSKIASRIKDSIDILTTTDARSRLKSNHVFSSFDTNERFNAYIFCSFGGGTGKGMALIIAAMLKEILHEKFHQERQRYNITVTNYLPICFRARGRSVVNDESTYQYILKNQYATYKEFDWCITHGYNNENFFKKYFNKPSNARTEDFVNGIYNISTNLESSGTTISSYDAVNKIVAEVFTFLVMNPESNAILQSISNDTQKEESSVNEKGTGLPRNRKYCRIGRYSLIMPEEQLFEYAKTFYVRKLLADLLEGGIEKGKSYYEITGPDGKPESRPEELSRKKNDELVNLFEKHYNRCPQLNAGELHYPDVQNYQLNNFINPINAQIQALDNYKIGFEKSEAYNQAKSIIDEFVKMSIRFSGLLFARDFIKEINLYLEKYIHLLLEKIKEKNEYGAKELLKGLGDEDAFTGTIEVEEFQFSIAEGVLNRLNEKLEVGIVTLRDYAAPEMFAQLTEVLQPFLKPKKKGMIRRIFKMVDDERIPFPEEGKSVIYGIVNNYNKQLAKIWPVFLAREYLNFAISLHKHINNRFERINDFTTLLSGTTEARAAFSLHGTNRKKQQNDDGLIREINSQLSRKAVNITEANESNIIGDNEQEFKIFAKNILPYDTIIKDVHNKFNLDVVNELFSSRLRAVSDELFIKTMRIVHMRLEQERFDEHKNKQWTILNYLEYLLFSKDKKTKQQIEENLLRMKLQSMFLSAVDANKFESPGAAEASFPQQNFLEISDENFLPANIKGWEEYTHKAKLIAQEDNNKITLTRVQGLIPLFAFTDLQEAQKLYQQTLQLIDSKQGGDVEDEKNRFKVKTHSSAYFMEGIDEPFGQTLQIDKSDAVNIWNMAFHLGIVSVSDSDYIQIVRDAHSNVFEDYEDPSLSQIRNRSKRRIKVRDYANVHKDYFHLTNAINDALFERLNLLAEDTKEGIPILTKYFTDINFPILTKALYDVIVNKLQDRKYRELIYFAKSIEQDYLELYDKIADSLMRKRTFVHNQKELLKEYNGATQYTKFFSNITKKNSKASEANRSRKLESIDASTKWLIIIEQAKEKPIEFETPQDWKTIDAKYHHLDYATVQLNFYTPKDDLIVSPKEFQQLIGKFRLEEEMSEAGIAPEIWDKTFHVVSKKTGKSVLLTKEARWSIHKVMECLNTDDTLLITEEASIKSKDIWQHWKRLDFLVKLFNKQTFSNDEEDEIILPD